MKKLGLAAALAVAGLSVAGCSTYPDQYGYGYGSPYGYSPYGGGYSGYNGYNRGYGGARVTSITSVERTRSAICGSECSAAIFSRRYGGMIWQWLMHSSLRLCTDQSE